jgi:nicotinate-nucleotide adenylyltransferase
MRQRLGIFGGTFNPIHHGHLLLASELAFALRLSRVLFVPARRPPHKPDQEIAPDADRGEMVRLAIAADPRFALDLIEMDREGRSYTADTLEGLAAARPEAQLVFLMGEDSLRDLATWHDPERIVRHAILGVAARPRVDIDLAEVERVLPFTAGRVLLVTTPEVDISSSDIRRRVAEGRPIAYHVPPAVERYILDRGLYRPDHKQNAAPPP